MSIAIIAVIVIGGYVAAIKMADHYKADDEPERTRLYDSRVSEDWALYRLTYADGTKRYIGSADLHISPEYVTREALIAHCQTMDE